MSDKRYTKVEEEVLEILDRLEHEEPATSRPNLRLVSSRPAKPQRRRRLRLPSMRQFPSWSYMAGSFALAFTAVMVRDSSDVGALALAIASALCFFAPLAFRRPSTSSGFGPSHTKEWRGRDISFGPSPHDSPGERARRWLDNRRNPRR